MFDWICQNYKLFLLYGTITLIVVLLTCTFGRTITGWWRWQKQEDEESKWLKLLSKWKKE